MKRALVGNRSAAGMRERRELMIVDARFGEKVPDLPIADNEGVGDQTAVAFVG